MSKKKTTEPTIDTTTVETAVATEPEPVPTTPKAKRKKKEETAPVADAPTPASDAAAPPAIAVEPAPAEIPAPKPKAKSKKTRTDVTLAAACEGYLRSLEDAGKSMGTTFSYKLELALAQRELGAETLVCDLTPERVQAFFVSDPVTKTRTGVLKADVSVAKTQRVLRQALVFAEKAGFVAKAPVPVETTAA